MKPLRSYVIPWLFFLSGVMLVAVPVVAMEYDVPVSGRVQATFAEGIVQMLTMTELDPQPIVAGTLIEPPVRVEVGEASRLELLLPDGSVLRFAEFTIFQLIEAEATLNRRRIDVDVALGDCWAKIKEFLGNDENLFHVSAPTATAGVAGTTYRLNVDYFQSSEYYVYSGAITLQSRWRPDPDDISGPLERVAGPERVPPPHRISMEEWSLNITAGYRIQLQPDGSYDDPFLFDRQIDQLSPWVQWNQERDRLF